MLNEINFLTQNLYYSKQFLHNFDDTNYKMETSNHQKRGDNRKAKRVGNLNLIQNELLFKSFTKLC